MVDFDAGASLFHLVRLGDFLDDKFGCKVDVVLRRALRKEVRDAVSKELVRLYHENVDGMYGFDVHGFYSPIRMNGRSRRLTPVH